MLINPNTYPIVIRVEKGYIVASQPDLEIYRARGRFEDLKRPEEIGAAVMEVWAEILDRIKKQPELAARPPSHPKDAIKKENPPAIVSIKKAAEVMGLSTTTVRKMCEVGKIQAYRTKGMHWKIKMSDPIISKLISTD